MLLLQNVRLFGNTRLIEIGMSIVNAVVNGQIETKKRNNEKGKQQKKEQIQKEQNEITTT